MKTMLVGYDLNKAGQNYDALIQRLKAYGTWWHQLDSTWLIKTDSSHIQVREELTRFIDSNDKLIVIDVTSAQAAWRGLPQNGTDWIKSHL